MSTEKIKIENLGFNGSCIYILRNINNNKIYIGSTKNYTKRMNEHSNDLRKGFHVNRHLQRSFNKGNIFISEILVNLNEEFLIEAEKHYCDLYNTYDKNLGYNIVKPQEMPKFIMTPEHLIKLRNARSLKGYDTSHLRTPEQIRRQAEGKYKKVNIYYNTGEFFKEAKSLIQAEELTGVKKQNIGAICKGIRKSCKGFYFKYKN